MTLYQCLFKPQGSFIIFFKEINEIDPILHRTKQSKVNHEDGENISEQSYCIQLNEVNFGFSKVNVFKKKKKSST